MTSPPHPEGDGVREDAAEMRGALFHREIIMVLGTLPALGGGTAPLTFPHFPHPHSGARLLHPGAPSPLLSSSGCPPRVDSFPRPGSPGFQTGVRPSHPMTPPTFPPPAIAVTGRQRPSPALLLRSGARGLQRRVSQSRVSPYPDSSPSPWGTRSCSTERS